MKALALCLCALAVATEDRWNSFKKTYEKIYDAREEDQRRQRYTEHEKLINDHNSNFDMGHTTYKLAINQFADLSHQEFSDRYKGLEVKDFHCPKHINTGKPVPQRFDWKEEGAVVPVKNQLDCNSCWAFSVTGTLEAREYLKTGILISLSEKQLLDCSGNKGCAGGVHGSAFDYIHEAGGIVSASSYPYHNRSDSCNFNPSHVVITCTGLCQVPSGSEYELLDAVANVGPVAIAFDASHLSFQHYHSGVYFDSNCSKTKFDHSALIVGYGREGQLDYWLVKNSYGESWGEHGYIKMARNKDNHCGIATYAYYPVFNEVSDYDYPDPTTEPLCSFS